ncbi:trypsin-like peptidase domain-containing protein [Pseudonocardia halophobica]|uniref:serine protease n=1 Tax=Pseudonocardia halophobica TaxID=29401 RepID=UPI003D911CC4
MDVRQQQERVAERYRRTAAEREEIRRRQEAAGTPVVVDDEDQLRARASRLLANGEVGASALSHALSDGHALRPTVLFERILGAASELQSVNFLARGERAARAVGRISILESGRLAGFGTGFLVGERLLLTNNHVLPDPDTATSSFVEFDLELDVDGVTKRADRYDLDPATLFVTHVDLDFSLVAVAQGDGGRRPGSVHGWHRLIANQGKIVIGEPVNIVGHPNGRAKEVAVRDNALLNQLPDYLHYRTDTEPGNSGSPVLNDQWEVVALHHAGVPGPDGQSWIANEGVRVSVLLTHLDDIELPPAQRGVLTELGPQAVPSGAVPGEVDLTPAAVPSQRPRARVPVGSTPITERRTAGLIGRARGCRAVVFLHGRGQEGQDPVRLRAAWAGGLARGLAAGGLAPLDAADVWFPFYGDALISALDVPERAPAPTAAETFAPTGSSTRVVYAELIDQAAARAGMPLEERRTAQEGGLLGGLVEALQGPLSWLADRSGLDDLVIAAVLRDVAAYLDRDSVRTAVLDAVRGCLPDDGELVLVGHSLGSVVAIDLLTQLPDRLDVPVLVTAGSPLGLDAVQKRLLAGGPVRPARVGSWLNAWAAADAVAIGCPLGDDWDQVRDVRTGNPKDRAHDIAEYLADPVVAGEIERSAR